MRTWKEWTEEDINFIREHYNTKGPTWIARELGRTYMSISNRGKILGLKCLDKNEDVYEVQSLRDAISSSDSYSDVLRRLDRKITGGNMKILKMYIEKFALDASKLNQNKRNSTRKIEPHEYLIYGSNIASTDIKRRILKLGIKQEICEKCQQGPVWNGEKLVLQLDHINGDSIDNRIENLRILCPNCHTQTKTHSMGVNKIKRMQERFEKIQTEKSKMEIERKDNAGFTLKEIGEHVKRRRQDRPPYNVLKTESEIDGYMATGRKYGVSHTSIKRWLKWYEKHQNSYL